MKLSIITPAAPKRKQRIASIFHRLNLNATRNPDIEFGFVIVDDSLDQEYLGLAQMNWKFPVKYIHLPLTEPYPNPSYMRNVAFRVATGEIFTMIDADHWVHEDFVRGAVEPFLADRVLNTGFMIDTSKGQNPDVQASNAFLLNRCGDLQFALAMRQCGINGPVECSRVWLAAYPGDVILNINGYDEQYTAGYSREDDDIYYRLATLLPIHKGAYKTFCGVHLWHPQAARSEDKNRLNREYYDRMNPRTATRNLNHSWGKFVEGASSFMGGVKRDHKEHETWIVQNNTRAHTCYVSEEPWKDFEDLRSNL